MEKILLNLQEGTKNDHRELDSAISSTQTEWETFHNAHPVLYRGLSEAGLDGRKLGSFLRGNRTYEPRGHLYSNLLSQEIEEGHSLDSALTRTDDRVSDIAASRIRAVGLRKFLEGEQRNAAVDRSAPEKKDVLSIFFGTEEWRAGSIFYAEDNALRRIENGESPVQVQAIVLELKESIRRGFVVDRAEYMIPGRVHAEDIQGAYVGAPVVNFRPNRHVEGFAWYYVSVEHAIDGSPKKCTIYRAEKVNNFVKDAHGRSARNLIKHEKLAEFVPGSGLTIELARVGADNPGISDLIDDLIN